MVVFSSIEASDGCRKVGTTFSKSSYLFNPTDLSTVRDNDKATYSFNLMDLPCPPASVGWPNGLPYQPRVVPPMSFFGALDPAWSACILGASQGVDPFTAFKPARNGGPDMDGGEHHGLPPFRRRQREVETAHAGATPSAVPKTTMNAV